MQRNAVVPLVNLTQGVVVRDGFLNQDCVQGLIDCAEKRRERGDFNEARVGAGRGLERRPTVRSDSICWISEPEFPVERRVLRELEQLRLDLNREAYLGLFELEIHYAWYEPGAAYARHVDRLRGDDGRTASIILYLNPAWHQEAGGELRIFDANGTYHDIEPVAGRLVCFLSESCEHAVLPTRQRRLSLTGWFRRRE